MRNDFESWTPVEPSQERLGGGLGREAVHAWLLALDQPARPMADLAALLAEDESARAHRFRFDRDRQRFIAGRGLLRLLLASYLGRDPAALRFSYGAAGKPLLDDTGNGQTGLTFNLSHSAGWALLGVTRERRIGVDIEAVRDTPDLDDVAKQNFAPAEQRARLALPAAARLDAFFAIWARKEAYLKAMGDGLLAPLDGFEVSVAPEDGARLTSIQGSSEAAAGWSMWGGKPQQGFWAAIAVEGVGLQLDTLTIAG
jgi:4'-phosphopantetheinyl transferase